MKNDCALGMLQFLIILCFLSVVGSNLKAQIVIPPKLEFIGLEENWSYISKDTNFIKSAVDKWSTPFWGHFPVDVYVDQEDIFIVSIRPTTYFSYRSDALVLPQKENEQKIFRRGKTIECVREKRRVNIGSSEGEFISPGIISFLKLELEY